MSELGSMLIRAREARGLTLEDAERDTRISRRYLQALESEQFEVIPAPVYARGFLRSYSQYLGLDPQEILSLFPTDDEVAGQHQSAPARASVRDPLSAVGPARPAWKRPGAAPAATAMAASHARPAAPEPPLEPTIGIDIGLPSPARRISTDPSAQARSMTVLIAAFAVVVGVVLLAFLISRFAGGANPADPAASPSNSRLFPNGTATSAGGVTSPSPSPAPSGLNVVRGVVPAVQDQSADVARKAIVEAGFVVSERRQTNAKPKGTVINQAPAPGVQQAEGLQVIIVVSDGP